MLPTHTPTPPNNPNPPTNPNINITTTQPSESVPPPLPPQYPKITRGHSCVLCQQRKVRCDRQKPCANCIKARAECVPSAPTLPRRRRRKLTETDLVGRVRKYEHLLKTHGIKIDDDDSPSEESSSQPSWANRGRDSGLSMQAPRTRTQPPGALFADKENSHYVESTLWENLRDEISDPKDALQGSSEDDINEFAGYCPPAERFLMSFGNAPKDLASLHPPAVQIFRLWQTFLVNCNPLVKMFHAPTVQQTILDASGDLSSVPRHTEALMFAIYFLAVSSLRNEDCEVMFGEQRTVLLSKYSHGTQQALINSKFLKSLNIFTLQALILFLLGVRNIYDPHSLWVLSGSTVRIGQRLGLHRDGSSHKISPFDAEIRRRTWWQIVFLDGQTSKLAGANFPAWLAKFDTKIPLNISDSDLSPTMKDIPTEKEGATEMIFCCLRYETAQALRNAKSVHRKGGEGHWVIQTGTDMMPEKDKAIDELEIRFQERFIKYCDPSIPLHLLAIYVAKSVICTMRIMAHHPRQYPDKGASMPQKEKDMLFAESLKELEYDTLGHTTPAIRGYLWHITSHFQLDAFIYLLSELRHRTTGDMVDRAWQQIKLSYDNRPEMITDTRNSLYTAIGNLALKSWAKREEALREYIAPPRFISLLRAQRNLPDPPRPEVSRDPFARPQIQTQSQPQVQPLPQHQPQPPSTRNDFSTIIGIPQNLGYSNQQQPQQQQQSWGIPPPPPPAEWGTTFETNIHMPEITPVDWEYWQTLMDGELPAYNGPDGGEGGNAGQTWFP